MNKIKSEVHSSKMVECLQKIEKKLGWQDSSDWQTQDFEQLSSLLSEETGMLLSVTTLKRLWGKIKYDSTPNRSTLDALAQFAGAKDWRNFKQQGKAQEAVKRTETPSVPVQNPTFTFPWKWVAILAIFLTGIGLYAFVWSSHSTILDPAKFSFKVRPVAQGLPNSVIFEYDASRAKAGDKVELQQNWDKQRRSVIDRDGKVVTSIYYTPGFFQAKLVINDQIMQEQDLLIASQGWLGLVEQTPVPLYFTKTEITQEDKISIPFALLEANNINPKLNDTWVNFYRIEDLGDLSVDNFSMETVLKNEYKEGVSACQKVEIILYCEGEVIISTLSIPGCIAENRLWILDQGIDGKAENLSAFGCDFSDWINVKWTASDDQISFFINDQLAYQAPLRGKKNKIMGVKYRFQGTGAVKSLVFKQADELVLSEVY